MDSAFAVAFGTSFEPGEPRPDPGSAGGLAIELGSGPVRSPTAKTGVGFTGLTALRYTGRARGSVPLFAVDVEVGPDTELSYVVFPEADDVPSYRSTFVAVELEFSDGTTLSGLGAEDQDGFGLSARAQGESKRLYLDQWNLVRCRIGGVARGRTIRAIRLTAEPRDDAEFTGWLDDLRIADRPEPGERDAVDWVSTTRGTHASRDFSRGNTFPATAVPNGFNFWTPVTDAGAIDWLYEYHRRNDEQNQPRLEAFAVSHQPSPWMGDRNSFQLMPGTGEVRADRAARALSFRHEHELGRPHHYAVRFDNGLCAEIAPADHAAMFRFTFPAGRGWVLFDNVSWRGSVRVDPHTGEVTGNSSVRSRLSVGARRMFVYGVFDAEPVAGDRLSRFPLRPSAYLAFDRPVVRLRIATSLISLAQARQNLELEIPYGTSFDAVSERARAQWQDLLGRVRLDGATEQQLSTFYSGLYRLFLYPNSGHENSGAEAEPRYRHASPVLRSCRPSTRTRTGAAVWAGKIAVNNGFWDTYRTAWPAYALLAPDRCGELIDGFLQHYREGGWIARWSSPGYADLMTGTSSDVAIADAYLKGVRGFDPETALDAGLRNATVTPPKASVGRKGLAESIFLGFTPADIREGLSWSLEGCVNDAGLAGLAAALAGTEHPRRREFADLATYLRDRAQRYAHHFDRRVGFFQGRTRDGGWRARPEDYDPAAWGYDYTETNGWNTAFSAPHDGKGLAALHGGPADLESTLDEFFATPETGRNPGSYGGIIHEMTEARDVRLGQYGHSNQPSHHIPFLYNAAGAPHKAHAVVREVLARCYLGGEIGQGYPGDEDNGEMSAWYVLCALGLYPLAVGRPEYVLTPPLFPRATIRLGSGADLVVTAPGNNPRTRYIHGVRINGEPWSSPTVPHEVLADGGTIDFALGETPGDWGTKAPTAEEPRPLTDLTGRVRANGDPAPTLTDDTTRTEVRFRSRTPVIEYTVDEPARPVRIYTLTSASRDGDPRSWVLEGSDDGVHWTELDRRKDQVFRWRRQTRPFVLATPAAHSHYRLRITEATARRTHLAQWELLAEPEPQGG